MANDIGTAYVRIAPSTQGLGKAINTAFQAQGDSAGKALGNTAKRGYIASGFTKAVVGGFAAATAAGVALVVKNFDKAVSRYDTLNNFPKVMQNFGISASDANGAIKKLDKGIQGLPTTLDSAASGVQRLTSKTGNVDKATDMFLAMNNAIIAGAAPMEIQATATEQLSQAYAKGKPDMMEWRSLMSAMPAQLNQVAQAMGYGANGADKLGEDLRSGKVSMDDFMNTIVTLDKEGGNGFQSFANQAKNATGGVGTAMELMNTAVTRGVTGLISGLDKGLAPFGGMKGAMESVGGSIEGVFKKIGESIPTIINGLNAMMPLLRILAPIFGAITAAILLTNAAIWIQNTYYKVLTVATTLWSGVTKLAAAAQWLLNAAMSANPISLIIIAIVALVAAFAILWNKSETFRNFWIGLWEGIKSVASTVVNAIKGFFTKTIPNAFNSFINTVKNVVKTALAVWTAFPRLVITAVTKLLPMLLSFAKKIPGKIKEGIGNLASIGKDVASGLWKGLKSAITGVFSKVKGLFKLLPKTIKKLLGIASPSKVFTWIGQMTGLGFGKGAIATFSMATNDINSEVDGLLSGFSKADSLDASYSSSHTIQNVPVKNDSSFVNALVAGFKLIADNMGNYKVVFDNREVARMVKAVQ